MHLETLTTAPELESLVPEWAELHASARTRNPFANPEWLAAWAHHYGTPETLCAVTARQEGQLVGVAPFFRRRYGAGAIAVERVQLIGLGKEEGLTELPQLLVRPGRGREVLRALMLHAEDALEPWDWIEFALGPGQGWPEWLEDRRAPGVHVVHKGSRRCVVLPLPGAVEQLEAGLKRNMREAVRRSRNRLDRAAGAWEVVDAYDSADGLEAALDELLALHRARAAMPDKPGHVDYFADGSSLAFLREAARRMHRIGCATPYLLKADGETIAARLVLRADDAVFLSISGFRPEWWHVGPGTVLMWEVLRRAVEDGATLANLSLGPDVGKLRWSEQIERFEEFAIVGPRRRSRVLFSIFWQARAAELVRSRRPQSLEPTI